MYDFEIGLADSGSGFVKVQFWTVEFEIFGLSFRVPVLTVWGFRVHDCTLQYMTLAVVQPHRLILQPELIPISGTR